MASGCVDVIIIELYNSLNSFVYIFKRSLRTKSLIKVSISPEDGRFSGFESQHFSIKSFKYFAKNIIY